MGAEIESLAPLQAVCSLPEAASLSQLETELAWFSAVLLAFPAAGGFSLTVVSAFPPVILSLSSRFPVVISVSALELHTCFVQDRGSWSTPNYQGNSSPLNSAGMGESSISGIRRTEWWWGSPWLCGVCSAVHWMEAGSILLTDNQIHPRI